jgi:hypothetical protein
MFGSKTTPQSGSHPPRPDKPERKPLPGLRTWCLTFLDGGVIPVFAHQRIIENGLVTFREYTHHDWHWDCLGKRWMGRFRGKTVLEVPLTAIKFMTKEDRDDLDCA